MTPTKDIMMDSAMYGSLFYILASPKMYQLTSKILPKVIKDRVLLHALVYMIVFLLIQKLTKRF